MRDDTRNRASIGWRCHAVKAALVAVTALGAAATVTVVAGEDVSERAAPPLPRAWVCVTPESFCATVPKPTGDPCSCPDPLAGWMPGRTLVYAPGEADNPYLLRSIRSNGPPTEPEAP